MVCEQVDFLLFRGEPRNGRFVSALLARNHFHVLSHILQRFQGLLDVLSVGGSLDLDQELVVVAESLGGARLDVGQVDIIVLGKSSD